MKQSLIQTIALAIVLTLTSNSAMAYVSDVDLSQNDMSVRELESINLKKMNSAKEFQKAKTKSLRQLRREIRKVKRLSVVEQNEYVETKIRKSFKRSRNFARRILNNNKVIRKLSSQKGMSEDAIRSDLTEKFTASNEDAFVLESLANIRANGSYLDTLKKAVKKVTKMEFNNTSDSYFDSEVDTDAVVAVIVVLVCLGMIVLGIFGLIAAFSAVLIAEQIGGLVLGSLLIVGGGFPIVAFMAGA